MDENNKLAKWLSGEMTAEELKAFKSEPDFAIYERIKKHSSGLEVTTFGQQDMLAKIVNSPKKKVKTVSFTQNWIFKVAAVLVIALGLFFTYKNFETSVEYAKEGTQNTFHLPDNSQVILNSGSEIEYKKLNWDNNRTLELKGEAYFKVAHGKKFEVNTPLGKVTVLGTKFNVKQRGGRFEVTCYEGRVKVYYNSTQQIITKGMSLSFEDGRPIDTPEIVVDSPEWLINEMAFNRADLTSILHEFERHFNVSFDIRVTDSGQLFTGTIPGENIDAALQVLSTIHHLKSTRVSKNKIIITAINAKK